MSIYTGEKVKPIGESHANVEYDGVSHVLPLIIVPDGSCALFG